MKEIKFPISDKSLYISKTMVDYKIFSKTVIFGHLALNMPNVLDSQSINNIDFSCPTSLEIDSTY